MSRLIATCSAAGFAALATLMVSGGDAQAACNVRGQFCGYPAWAANAFSHPRERVPDYVLEDRARMEQRVLRAQRSYHSNYSRYRVR